MEIKEELMKIAMSVFMLLCFIVPIGVLSQTTVGGGDLTFPSTGAGNVFFSHEMHVKMKKLKCTGCHYHVFQMTKGSYKMDMTKITKGSFCGKCHNGQKAFDVKDPNNCAKCHK